MTCHLAPFLVVIGQSADCVTRALLMKRNIFVMYTTLKTWKVIKSIWPIPKKQAVITSMMGTDCNYKIANHLNNHFSSVGEKLNANITLNIQHTHRIAVNNGLPDLSDVRIDEVWDLLKDLSPFKATGSDGNPARLIKACGDTILKPLHYIFNLSIRSGIFPWLWKQANVTPLCQTLLPPTYMPMTQH